MQTEAIKKQLEHHLPGALVTFEGEQCHFQIIIVWDGFVGLSRVQRQQRVYQHLSEAIASGSLHAVSMSTFTCEEWQKKQER